MEDKYNEMLDFISETFNVDRDTIEEKYFKWQNTKILNSTNPDIVNAVSLFKQLGSYFNPENGTNS